MKIGQQIDQARRATFVKAVFNEAGESRVDVAAVRASLIAAINEDALELRIFSKGEGSVGYHVSLKFEATNEKGESFDLKGNVLVYIPETVVKKA